MTAQAKRLIAPLFFFLLLAGGAARAEGVVFFEGTWEEALAKAAKENKYIMLDAYTEWCGWCKVMDRETFPDPAVGAVVNENFIPVKIDFEKGIGIELGMKFRVNSYPTTLFFNPDGQLVHINHGYSFENADFIATCRAALDVKQERVFAFDSRDLSVPFPDFYRKSFLTGDDRVWPKEAEVVAFLDGRKDLLDEVSWSVLWRFGGGEKYQEFLLTMMDEYAKRYGREEVEAAGLSIVQGKVFMAAKEKDEKALDEAVAMVDKYFKRKDNEKMKLLYRQLYYERTENWTAYADASSGIIAMENYTNLNRVNSICWTLYENTDDREILKKGVMWMKPVVALEDSYAYLDTYAALLYKTGDLQEAEKQAKLAIEKGKASGEDVSATEELLQKITAGR